MASIIIKKEFINIMNGCQYNENFDNNQINLIIFYGALKLKKNFTLILKSNFIII